MTTALLAKEQAIHEAFMAIDSKTGPRPAEEHLRQLRQVERVKYMTQRLLQDAQQEIMRAINDLDQTLGVDFDLRLFSCEQETLRSVLEEIARKSLGSMSRPELRDRLVSAPEAPNPIDEEPEPVSGGEGAYDPFDSDWWLIVTDARHRLDAGFALLVLAADWEARVAHRAKLVRSLW